MRITDVSIEVIFSGEAFDGIAGVVMGTEVSSRWGRKVGIVTGKSMTV